MSKHRPPHYRPGSHLKTCDLSGRVDYAENFVKQWNGLIVHKDYYEPRNPQDFTDSVPNRQSVPDPRLDILTVTTGTPSMVQVSASVDVSGLFIYLRLNRDIDTATSGVSVTADGSPVTVSTYANIGSGVLLLGVDQIESGQTVLLSYAPGDIAPVTGSDLAAFSDLFVENNSTYVVPVVADAYPLNDDGTVAAIVGVGWISTDAPNYLLADYTYSAPATGNAAAALPSAANWLGSQAITVGAGKVLACEMEIIAVPAGGTYDDINLLAVTSNGGTQNGGYRFGVSAGGGGTVYFNDNGSETLTPIVAAVAGFRIGLVFDGNTGDITAVSTDGTYGVVGSFTTGDSVTFGLYVQDSGGTPNTESVSLTLVPAAANMTLTYPAGTVDVFGDTI